MSWFSALIAGFVIFGLPRIAISQTPTPPPPPPWVGSVSVGLALTQGNSDTSTVNAAYELKHDTGAPLVVRSNGLLVYGKAKGVLTSDRLALDGRIERRFHDQTAVFLQTQYLRDSFKSIDYLVSPTIGLSHVFVDNDRTELNVDASAGVVLEQNPDVALKTDAALKAGQQLTHKLTETTEFIEKVGALWKIGDFGDALYTIGVSLAASITERTQMKAEFLDTFKTKPPLESVQRNDIAMLLSFVYKFE